MFLLSFLICVLVSWIGYFVWKERKWIVMCGKLHREPWNLPVLGCANLVTQGSEARMTMLARFGRISIKQGGLTSLWLGPRFFVMVSDANIADIILKTSLEKDDVMEIAHEFLGNGSIFAPVKIWRPRRKTIAPTFSMKNLNQFVEVFYRQSCTMVEQLKDAAGKGTFSVWKYLTTYTMDSVCETALGVHVNAQRHSNHPFIEAFETHCRLAAARLVLPPFVNHGYKRLPIYKTYLRPIHTMWRFVDDIIKTKQNDQAEKEKTLLSNNNNTKTTPLNTPKSFLELFMECSGGSSGFTSLELREETLVLLLAGTDTSAVGSAFTCLMLARHPEEQEKVYEEIKEVLGDSDRPITAKDLPNLKYLEAAVKESLRLYPPVPVIVRKVEKDFQIPTGQTLVRGTALMINIWAVHRNPHYWGEDAEEFKPDRFIGATLSHPAAYMPFSHGPRSCLGYQYAMMSMKTTLANLVRHYRVRPASPVPHKDAPLRIKFDIMMKHVENFQLQMEPRN